MTENANEAALRLLEKDKADRRRAIAITNAYPYEILQSQFDNNPYNVSHLSNKQIDAITIYK